MKSPGFHPTLDRLLAGRGLTPRHVTAFDPSAVLQRALAAYLRGEDFAVGPQSCAGRLLGRAMLSLLPPSGRAFAYQLGTRIESVPARSLGTFRSEATSRWIASGYPRRRSRVAFLGSSNGAAVHLAAALEAPWLPPHRLILVRLRGLDPDDPVRALTAGRQVAGPLLTASPELELHQLHDPIRDRLLGREALYFRLKRRTLGPTYERFLLDRVEPGGTLVIVDCSASWPAATVGDRHFFQLGGLGAQKPSDYYDGGEPRWDAPPPDRDRPESEWGYSERLTSDVLRFADRYGYRVVRIAFEHPEHLSPWVADLYREHVIPDGAPVRLVVQPSFLADPWCIQRSGSVPFWTAASTTLSESSVEAYVNDSAPFDEIRAEALGMKEADFRTYLRYHQAWRRLPDASRNVKKLNWADVEAYSAGRGKAHAVRLQLLTE